MKLFQDQSISTENDLKLFLMIFFLFLTVILKTGSLSIQYKLEFQMLGLLLLLYNFILAKKRKTYKFVCFFHFFISTCIMSEWVL